MNDLTCPACQHAMTFWNIAKAPTPYHLTCNHCKTKLKNQRHSLFILSIGVLVPVAIAAICLHFHLSFAYLMGMLAIGALPAELVSYYAMLRLGAGLGLRERQP